MNVMRKLLLHFILLLFCCAVHAGEIKFFPKGTAVWNSSDMSQNALGLGKGVELEIIERSNVSFSVSVLTRNVTLYHVAIDGREYWLSPDVRVAPDGGVSLVLYDPNWIALLAPVLMLLSGILCVLAYWGYDRWDMKKSVRFRRVYFLPCALVLFHLSWVGILRALYPEVFHSVVDEQEYFRVARCFVDWDFSKPFHYTIGYPLFCVPFAAIFGNDFLGMSQCLSVSYAFVLVPANIVMAWLLIKKLSASDVKAFLSIVLVMLVPKFFLVMDMAPQHVIFSPLGRSHSQYIYLVYQYILNGYNSLSEPLSMCVLLGAMLLAYCWRGGMVKYIVVGLVFGFAMLVRMNNLCAAPVVAYLLWLCDREKLSGSISYVLKALGCAFVAAFAVFGWQLFVNYLHQGSIFKTPYTLINIQQERVGVRFFANMSMYYFRIHSLIFVLPLLGMVFTRDRNLRNVLVLWSFPMILFFFCFNYMGYPYRFFVPLYPALAAGLVCSDIWSREGGVKRYVLAALLLFMVFPSLPLDLHIADFMNVIKSPVRNIVAIFYKVRLIAVVPVWLAGLFYFRKNKERLIFLLLFGVMITVWSGWLMVLGMAGMVVFAIIQMVSDYIKDRRNNERFGAAESLNRIQ